MAGIKYVDYNGGNDMKYMTEEQKKETQRLLSEKCRRVMETGNNANEEDPMEYITE